LLEELRHSGPIFINAWSPQDLVELALVNAIHNSLNHARTRLRIEAGMQEGCLVLRLHGDSTRFPDKVLNAVVVDVPRHPRGTGLGFR